MNRNRKIIYGIILAFIVIALVIGITYAYIMTNIAGNTNSKSMTVDLKNSRLEFNDLSTNNKYELIEPGYIDYKLFTVKNIGNDTATYNIYLSDVVNTFARKQDLKYTLYKKIGNNTIDTSDLSDCTEISSGMFPIINSYIKFGESIEPSDIYTYALKVEYLNSVENQDSNKGKTFGGKVQIDGLIQNLFNEGSLAYTILDNAIKVTDAEKELGYAEYSTFPKTLPIQQTSGDDESTLSRTLDDIGYTYYFRGNVKNNYLNFAGYCWRIVRIEGDGSIKVILEDSNYTCNHASFTGNWTFGSKMKYGYDSNNRVDFINAVGGLADTLESYQSTLNASVGTTYNNKSISYYLKNDDWCYDTTITNTNDTKEFYASYTRYSDNNPSIICSGNKINEYRDNNSMYVGALTSDELVFAGANSVEHNYYLINNYTQNNTTRWWTLSPDTYSISSGWDNVFIIGPSGKLAQYQVNSSTDVYSRPVITLKSDVNITTGNGSIDNPYIVS